MGREAPGPTSHCDYQGVEVGGQRGLCCDGILQRAQPWDPKEKVSRGQKLHQVQPYFTAGQNLVLSVYPTSTPTPVHTPHTTPWPGWSLESPLWGTEPTCVRVSLGRTFVNSSLVSSLPPHSPSNSEKEALKKQIILFSSSVILLCI